ncbi:PH domain-containing protein [Symbiobacterium terraclitae]|uniref:PH domain-containing protein n=1 Tax=Symbiobacterium terraclitae TaxID=557451 RepID=UPI0035B558D1
MRHFPSERAPWLTLLIWGLLPGGCLAMLIVQLQAPIPWWTWFLTAELPMVMVTALAVWIWLTTGYSVTETELIVRSAFLTWRTPLSAITRVRPTRNPPASAALSLNRLEIRTRKGAGPLISPQRRDEFLQLLRERCPHARIEG